MLHGISGKIVNLITPQSVATNGTATATVNVSGFRYAEVLLSLSTAVASNVDVTLTLTEGDSTSSFATHADLAMTTAAPNTSNPQIYYWGCDLRKRKKFLKITYAPNTSVARVASAIIRLTRAEQTPTSLADMGVDARSIS